MKSMTPIRDLTAAARAGLSGNWGKAILLMLIYGLLSAGISGVPFAGCLLQLVFAAPLVVGVHIYFLSAVRGQPATLGQLFDGLGRFGTSWCAYMLVVLIIAAWMIPFAVLVVLSAVFLHLDPATCLTGTAWMIPAVLILAMSGFLIVLQMRYYLVLYIVADDPLVRARQAVRRSAELMKGNYWRLGLLWLRFTGWSLLVPLTLFIGLIWLIPYLSAATAAFYDDLTRNG
jgi:uncharacterized membrane protein